MNGTENDVHTDDYAHPGTSARPPAETSTASYPRGDVQWSSTDGAIHGIAAIIWPPPSVDAARAAGHRAATQGAWLLWRQYLCEEANRGHPWVLAIRAGTAHIECEHRCGAFPDLGYDGYLYVNARIPVTVEIDAGMTPVDYGTGWEGYMDVTIEPDPARINREETSR